MNERQLAILIDEIGHLQNELRGCNKDIFALEKENADLRNKLDLSETVNTTADKNWKLKYEALLIEYEKLESKVNDLRDTEDELALLQADYDDLAYDHDELKNDYHILENECRELEVKFENMSKMFEAEVKRYDDLFERYTLIHDERNHLDEMLRSAEEDLLAAQAKVETYENFEFDKRAVDEAVAQYINDWEKAGY